MDKQFWFEIGHLAINEETGNKLISGKINKKKYVTNLPNIAITLSVWPR